MSDVYDLVRRSDSKVMGSFPAGGRYQVYTANGIASVRPLSDEEVTTTPAGMIQILERLGFHVSNNFRE